MLHSNGSFTCTSSPHHNEPRAAISGGAAIRGKAVILRQSMHEDALKGVRNLELYLAPVSLHTQAHAFTGSVAGGEADWPGSPASIRCHAHRHCSVAASFERLDERHRVPVIGHNDERTGEL